MRRLMLAFAFVAAASAAAFADDTRVRSSATVEVLDDKAQIDDVISRMRTQQAAGEARTAPATAAATGAAKAAAGALKQDRPPAASSTADGAHRAVGPEAKDQLAGSRRSNRERNGNPDHTERPRHRRR